MRLSRRFWMEKPLSSTAEAQQPLLNDYLLPNQTEPALSCWTCWGVWPKFGGELSCLAVVPRLRIVILLRKSCTFKKLALRFSWRIASRCLCCSVSLYSYFQKFLQALVRKVINKLMLYRHVWFPSIIYVSLYLQTNASSERSNENTKAASLSWPATSLCCAVRHARQANAQADWITQQVNLFSTRTRCALRARLLHSDSGVSFACMCVVSASARHQHLQEGMSSERIAQLHRVAWVIEDRCFIYMK